MPAHRRALASSTRTIRRSSNRVLQGCAAGLDRWPQRADRPPLGGRMTRSHPRLARNWSARAGRHPGSAGRRRSLRPSGNRDDADRVRTGDDPVGSGFVAQPRRGRAATSPDSAASNTGWAGNGLSCSRRSRPGATRAAVMFNPDTASGIGVYGVIESAAPVARGRSRSLRVIATGEIERSHHGTRARAEWRPDRDGGRVRSVHRELIISRWRLGTTLPAVYLPHFVEAGGLISYGADLGIPIGAPASTSIASSRARSPPICRCRRRPNSSW